MLIIIIIITQLVVGLYPLDGPQAVIRVDPASGFVSLKNSKALQHLGISVAVCCIKNTNKNRVAERAVLELEEIYGIFWLGSSRSQFFAIRTDPKPANNLFIFSCNKLAYKWVYTANFVIELAGLTCHLRTILKNITSKRVSNSDTRQRKPDVLKNRFNSNCFMIAASSSLVKFSKIVFPE